MQFVINPGTEPVANTTADNALININALLADIELNVGTRIGYVGEKNGRYDFILKRDDRQCEVSMPGLPLDQMRLGPWKSPRLYVNGSSWLWEFSLGFVHTALTGIEED